MGSFIGHVVPGAFFFLFSFWWAWSVFHRYFICRRETMNGSIGGRANKQGNYRYRNTLTYPCVCCSTSIPIESMLKIFAVAVGMLGEFCTAFGPDRFSLHNAQHMTMFFFFGLQASSDILLHYGFPLPHNIDYLLGIFSFGMEGFLFYFHLHGRNPLDVQVHMFLVFVVVATVVSVSLEMRHKYNILPVLCRIYFTMLQGTWLFQIGFILHPPSGDHWDENDAYQMMIVTLLFAWHNAAIFFSLSIMGTIICFRVKSMDRADVYQYLHPFLNYKLLDNGTSKLNSEQTKNIIGDSEDEEEMC